MLVGLLGVAGLGYRLRLLQQALGDKALPTLVVPYGDEAPAEGAEEDPGLGDWPPGPQPAAPPPGTGVMLPPHLGGITPGGQAPGASPPT